MTKEQLIHTSAFTNNERVSSMDSQNNCEK